MMVVGGLREKWWWRVRHIRIVRLVCPQSKQLNVMLYMRWFGFINWLDWWVRSQHHVQIHLVAGRVCCIAICWKKIFNYNFNLKFCVMMICIITFNVLFVNESLKLFCVVIKTICEKISFLIDYFIFLSKTFRNLFS